MRNRSTHSRRQALGILLGAGGCLRLRAAEPNAPMRLAISESLVSDVNLTDARAAMQIWLKRMMADLNVVVELDPKVFEPSEEILRRARNGTFDTVALNVVEYRQVAGFLDASHIIAESGTAGAEQYLLLANRNSGIHTLGDLRKRRLAVLKSPKMCVAPAWLSTLLDAGHFGPADQFFGAITTETKVPRVVLPAFFGQTDACLTSKRGFDTMCELNPQVAKDLVVVAASEPMLLTFYIFHRNYRGLSRERFAKVYADLPSSAAGRQLAVLFQFESLVVKETASLAPALAVLEAADRIRERNGGRKG
jgi:phosphonate transport system substrate-binding protein